MALEFLKLDDDLRRLAAHAFETLTAVSSAANEAQRFFRNADEGVTEARELKEAFHAGAEAFVEALTKGKS